MVDTVLTPDASQDSAAKVTDTKEDLDARHRKEQRDLQGRITQKKKQATKKTRKGVNDECEQLERELKDRQARERDEMNGTSMAQVGEQSEVEAVDDDEAPGQAELNAATGTLSLNNTVDGKTDVYSTADDRYGLTKGKKGNRQRARLARRAAEQEAAAEEAAKEAGNMTDYKAREQEVISAAISSRDLTEHRVRSDGHCLYAAMADQLDQAGIPLRKAADEQDVEEYRIVRQEVAKWVVQHPDDYLPFLDEEDMVKGIDGYASKIRDTGEWGGQLEIAACARKWNLVVNILQGDGRIEKIESGDKDSTECWLAYYKHSFGLGEHYNSLRKQK